MIVLAEETTISVIQAISELWKLGLVVVGGEVFVVLMIFFRKQIRALLDRHQKTTIKRGQTELSVDTGSREPKSGEVSAGEGVEKKGEEGGKEKEVVASGPSVPGDAVGRMLEAFVGERFDEAESAFAEMQNSEENDVERHRNEAWYLYLQYIFKHEVSALGELEKLARNAKAKKFAVYRIGLCYKHARNYPHAIKTMRESLIEELDDGERARRVRSLAECLSESGQRAEALKELEVALRQVAEDSAKAELYSAIAEVHLAEDNKIMRAIALQKALQYSPDDTRLLFSAGWAGGEAEMPLLAVLNYETLLRFKPKSGAALNNLGVQCEGLGLPIMGVSYYRKAGTEKNTLALSNLAYRCISAGLEKEAREAIETAMHEEKPHKNVGQAKGVLEEKKEEEWKVWNEYESKGIKQQMFVWEYAENYFVRDAANTSFAGQWVTPEGNVFEVKQDGDKVSGRWEQEYKGEMFQGCVRGRSMELQYERKGPAALFGKGGWGDKQAGIGYWDAEGRNMSIQVGSGKEVFFLRLVRKE